MEKLRKNHSAKSVGLMATAMTLGLLTGTAGEGAGIGYGGGGSGIVNREMSKMTERAYEAEQALIEGDKLFKQGKREEALNTYQAGLNLLPNAPVFAERRAALTSRVATASLALAQEKRKNGDYDAANRLLENVLTIDPTNEKAMLELERIADPEYSNPALSPAHVENVRTVSALLAKGEGYYNLGLYDEALEQFTSVLRIDPYNRAARRFMEKVESEKARYYTAAYDQMRAKLLNDVSKAWELEVPSTVVEIGAERPRTTLDPESDILGKLKRIKVSVDFDNTDVESAIDYLRSQADQAGEEINFIINTPKVDGGGASLVADPDAPVIGNVGEKTVGRLKLKDVPMLEVLKYIVNTTGLRLKFDPYAVQILPAGGEGGDLYTRTFSVPPNFYTALAGIGGGGGSDDPFGGGDPFASESDGPRIEARKPIQELLGNAGVTFDGEASATYISLTSTLVVRNSQANLDMIEAIIEEIRRLTPKQIMVSTKFVEINQENTDELGFDWLVSPLNLTQAGETFLGGGTIGNGANRTNADFINTVPGGAVPGVPSIPGLPVDQIVTGGNRSGDFGLSSDSIDNIINNPSRSAQQQRVAPGILNFTGIFSSGTINVMMRGLAQKKGTDVMTAPSIMARPGETATIEIIREFIYPTEYDPPELPNSVGGGIQNGGVDGGGGGGLGGGFPVTPANPTAFETRNTGVTLEIEPTLGDNDYVIDLRFAPEIVEFEGFINYGSPIQATAQDALGNTQSLTITENRIEMPVFATRRVNTSLTIYDGHTVAIGGLIREEVENIEDKVPVLGDLPLVGRLFQTKAESRKKSNLVIFVSANIIDATGRRIRDNDGSLIDGASPMPSLLPSAKDAAVGLPDDDIYKF